MNIIDIINDNGYKYIHYNHNLKTELYNELIDKIKKKINKITKNKSDKQYYCGATDTMVDTYSSIKKGGIVYHKNKRYLITFLKIQEDELSSIYFVNLENKRRYRLSNHSSLLEDTNDHYVYNGYQLSAIFKKRTKKYTLSYKWKIFKKYLNKETFYEEQDVELFTSKIYYFIKNNRKRLRPLFDKWTISNYLEEAYIYRKKNNLTI